MRLNGISAASVRFVPHYAADRHRRRHPLTFGFFAALRTAPLAMRRAPRSVPPLCHGLVRHRLVAPAANSIVVFSLASSWCAFNTMLCLFFDRRLVTCRAGQRLSRLGRGYRSVCSSRPFICFLGAVSSRTLSALLMLLFAKARMRRVALGTRVSCASAEAVAVSVAHGPSFVLPRRCLVADFERSADAAVCHGAHAARRARYARLLRLGRGCRSVSGSRPLPSFTSVSTK